MLGLLRMLFRLFKTSSTIHSDRRPIPTLVTNPEATRRAVPPSAPLYRAAPAAPPPAPQQQAAIVGACYVVDGDTIMIGNTSIRLAGIDAPELDQPYGKKAKWELLTLTKGQIIRAELDGSMSYDRTVARCYLPDGRDLSLEMVKLGMALDWGRFSEGGYRAYEPPGIRKKLWRVAAKHRGQFPPTK